MSTKRECSYVFKKGKSKNKKCTRSALDGSDFCNSKGHNIEHISIPTKSNEDNIITEPIQIDISQPKIQEKSLPITVESKNDEDDLLCVLDTFSDIEDPEPENEQDKKRESRKKDLDFMVKKSKEALNAQPSQIKKKSEPTPSVQTGETIAGRPLVTNLSLIKIGVLVCSGAVESICVANGIPLDGLKTELMNNQEFMDALDDVMKEYSSWFSFESTPEMKLLAITLMISSNVFIKNSTNPNYKATKSAEQTKLLNGSDGNKTPTEVIKPVEYDNDELINQINRLKFKKTPNETPNGWPNQNPNKFASLF